MPSVCRISTCVVTPTIPLPRSRRLLETAVRTLSSGIQKGSAALDTGAWTTVTGWQHWSSALIDQPPAVSYPPAPAAAWRPQGVPALLDTTDGISSWRRVPWLRHPRQQHHQAITNTSPGIAVIRPLAPYQQCNEHARAHRAWHAPASCVHSSWCSSAHHPRLGPTLMPAAARAPFTSVATPTTPADSIIAQLKLLPQTSAHCPQLATSTQHIINESKLLPSLAPSRLLACLKHLVSASKHLPSSATHSITSNLLLAFLSQSPRPSPNNRLRLSILLSLHKLPHTWTAETSRLLLHFLKSPPPPNAKVLTATFLSTSQPFHPPSSRAPIITTAAALVSGAPPSQAPLSPKQQAAVIWALTSTGQSTPKLLHSLLRTTLAPAALAHLPAASLSSLLWSLATLHHHHQSSPALSQAASSVQPPTAPAANGTPTPWAHPNPTPHQQQALLSALAPRLPDLSPRQLSLSIRATSILPRPDATFLSAATAAALVKLPDFSLQDLATTARALSQAGHYHPQLFSQMASASVKLLRALQGTTNRCSGPARPALLLTQAHDSTPHPHPDHLSFVNPAGDPSSTTSPLASGKHAHGITSPVRFGKPAPPPASNLQQQAQQAQQQQLASSHQHSICQLAWAYGKATHYDPELFTALADLATPHAASFHPAHLSQLLWAMAHLDSYHPALVWAAAQAVATQLPQVNGRALADLAWSLVVLRHMDRPLLEAIFARVAQQPPGCFNWVELCQLYQVDLVARSSLMVPSQLPDRLQGMAHDAWVSQTLGSGGSGHASGVQRQVAAVLAGMGLRPVVGYRTADGLLLADIAVDVSSHRVAFEVVTAAHLAVNDPGRALGATVLRRRCFLQKGWRVVPVDAGEWGRLGGRAAQEALLERKLRDMVQGRGDATWSNVGSKGPPKGKMWAPRVARKEKNSVWTDMRALLKLLE